MGKINHTCGVTFGNQRVPSASYASILTDLDSSLVMYLSEDLEVVSDVFQVFKIGHHFGQGPGHLVEVLPQWVLDNMVGLGVEATTLPLGNRSIGVQIWGKIINMKHKKFILREKIQTMLRGVENLGTGYFPLLTIMSMKWKIDGKIMTTHNKCYYI